MTASGFARALAHVLVYEGGKVDDPRDPGGRTNQGITQRVYDWYRVRNGALKRDVYLMDAVERDSIYRVEYWNMVHGDDLPAGVDFATFDGGVNSGPSRSVKWLQQALGVLPDGVIGPVTLAALAATDNDALIGRMEAYRLAFLRQLPRWPTFGGGWAKRVQQLTATAQAWATGSVGPAPVFIPNGNAKAHPEPIPAPIPQTPPTGLISALMAILKAIVALFARKA